MNGGGLPPFQTLVSLTICGFGVGSRSEFFLRANPATPRQDREGDRDGDNNKDRELASLIFELLFVWYRLFTSPL